MNFSGARQAIMLAPGEQYMFIEDIKTRNVEAHEGSHNTGVAFNTTIARNDLPSCILLVNFKGQKSVKISNLQILNKIFAVNNPVHKMFNEF
ncbi:MAG: hypothetical protein LBK03_01020 [Bacteroidales bacterium]|nr:hypothetical protein [Bacteroidales bacterium]